MAGLQWQSGGIRAPTHVASPSVNKTQGLSKIFKNNSLSIQQLYLEEWKVIHRPSLFMLPHFLSFRGCCDMSSETESYSLEIEEAKETLRAISICYFPFN